MVKNFVDLEKGVREKSGKFMGKSHLPPVVILQPLPKRSFLISNDDIVIPIRIESELYHYESCFFFIMSLHVDIDVSL